MPLAAIVIGATLFNAPSSKFKFATVKDALVFTVPPALLISNVFNGLTIPSVPVNGPDPSIMIEEEEDPILVPEVST
jgi:hypothetical protein